MPALNGSQNFVLILSHKSLPLSGVSRNHSHIYNADLPLHSAREIECLQCPATWGLWFRMAIVVAPQFSWLRCWHTDQHNKSDSEHDKTERNRIGSENVSNGIGNRRLHHSKPTQKPTSPTLLTRWLRFVLADMKNNSVSYLCARLWCLFCKRSSSESPRWFRSCWDVGISAPSFVQ